MIKVGLYAPVVTCPSEDYDGDGIPDGLVFSTARSAARQLRSALPEVTDNCSAWEVHTEILTEVEVDVAYRQYGQVIGTALDTVVVRVISWDASSRIVSGIEAGSYYFRYTVEDACGNTVCRTVRLTSTTGCSYSALQ